jgi:hypothetical protein
MHHTCTIVNISFTTAFKYIRTHVHIPASTAALRSKIPANRTSIYFFIVVSPQKISDSVAVAEYNTQAFAC